MELFDYPKNAFFGRVLPKSKIYEKANPGSIVKEAFIRKVEKIVWAYKLAPETVNIAGTEAVPEIEVFNIHLKDSEHGTDFLACIDKAIPLPIIFELFFEEKFKLVAAYKRISEADSKKRVLSSYFATEWLPIKAERKPLPVLFNLEELYERMISGLVSVEPLPEDDIESRISRHELIQAKEKDIARLEARLHKEKQFNRKVVINAEIRLLKNLIADLSDQKHKGT